MQCYLIKGQVKNFYFTDCIFVIKMCCNCFCLFFNNFITNNRWIILNTCQIFTIFITTCSRIPNISFFTSWCFWHSHQHLLLFYHWSELHFVLSYLHLNSHDICFVNIFYPFILVIILSTLRFKFFVLFGTHTLLDKLLRVLQLPKHQFI